MSSRRGSRAARATWICAALLSAGAPVAAQAAGTITTIDGRSLSGVLTVAADGSARVAAEAAATDLRYDELVEFAVPGNKPEPSSAPHRVWLRSGLELPAVELAGRAGGDGKPAALLAKLPVGIELALPLGAIAAFRHGGDERPQPAAFPGDRSEPPANNDVLFVHKDGKTTRSAVTITGFTEQRIDFELRGKEYDFELTGVCGVVFGRNTGFAADRQPRPRTLLELRTGERLEGRLLRLDSEVELRLDEGLVITAKAAAIQRLQVASDRLRWLGEFTPKVEQTPAFDRTWPWTVDRSIAGPGLLLGGKTHARGLCMVPRTRLTYELPGDFDAFEAVIGIDDRAGPEAHADFRVYVDQKLAFEANGRTRGITPLPIQVPLTGAKTLVLEVDFGKNYDLGDYCLFADARLIRR